MADGMARGVGRFGLVLGLVITVAVLAGGAWWIQAGTNGKSIRTLGEVVQPGAAEGYHVLLVTLDTTRADHLGCYGYEGIETPTIDSLCAPGARFADAVTSVPVTLPSHTTIMTGLYPYHHGVRNNGTYEVAPEITTLAEILKGQGYDTAAFIACFVLEERFGLNQGFDTYDFDITESGRRGPLSLASERGANHVSSAAIKWLGKWHKSEPQRPFFMWVHYYDPHSPYEPSPEIYSVEDRERMERGNPTLRYDAEIAYMDLHLKRLLDKVDELGLRERTLIVVASDHGEALGEHGASEHGGFIYDASMHAAFILSCPTLFPKSYVLADQIVGTIDILPTVTELLGLPAPAGIDGRGLVSAPADPDRAIYMETLYTIENMGCAPLYGLRRHQDKYILAPRPEYYDLRRDPRELQNLYGSKEPGIPDLLERLAGIMKGWPEQPPMPTRDMSEEEIERLADLGYVAEASGDASGELPDPKDQVPLLETIGLGREMMKQGRYDEALELMHELRAEAGCVDLPVYLMADIYVETNRRAEAAALLGSFKEECPPANVELHVRLASELIHLKRFEEAERELEEAKSLDPRVGPVYVLKGDLLFEQQRFAEAVEQYRKGIAIDGERLGSVATDKLRDAVEAMERAGN